MTVGTGRWSTRIARWSRPGRVKLRRIDLGTAAGGVSGSVGRRQPAYAGPGSRWPDRAEALGTLGAADKSTESGPRRGLSPGCRETAILLARRPRSESRNSLTAFKCRVIGWDRSARDICRAECRDTQHRQNTPRGRFSLIEFLLILTTPLRNR